jgi:hypothetical protein
MKKTSPRKPTFDGNILRDSYAFIIRIWCEAFDEKGNVSNWRGSIDYVGGNQRLYFENLDGIVRFIQEQTKIRLNNNFTWWQFIVLKVRHGLARYFSRL